MLLFIIIVVCLSVPRLSAPSSTGVPDSTKLPGSTELSGLTDSPSSTSRRPFTPVALLLLLTECKLGEGRHQILTSSDSGSVTPTSSAKRAITLSVTCSFSAPNSLTSLVTARTSESLGS